MSKQPNTDKSNRAAKRRAKRDATRVPGKGAGVPIPIQRDSQPGVRSLRELAKTGGGQVPLSIPQLMAQVGSLKIERDFWMNAALSLEEQLENALRGKTPPTAEQLAAAEEDEDAVAVVLTECPECAVVLGLEAVHAEGCSLTNFDFEAQEEEEPEIVNIPEEEPATALTEEEQSVVAEAQASIAGAEQKGGVPPGVAGVAEQPSPTPISEAGAPEPSDPDGGG